MINLLPSEQKKELKQEENLKLTLILGIIILAWLVSLGLILFSIKIYILGELEIQNIFLMEKENELKNEEVISLERKMKDYNEALLKLDSFYQKEGNLTNILEDISRTLPKGTYLTTLNFDSALSRFNLSGFCPNRTTLLTFKANLEKEEKLREVYFPPANWVTPSDINFSVNFKTK